MSKPNYKYRIYNKILRDHHFAQDLTLMFGGIGWQILIDGAIRDKGQYENDLYVVTKVTA